MLIDAQLSCTYGSSLNPRMFVDLAMSTSYLNMSYAIGYQAPPSNAPNASRWYIDIPYQDWPLNAMTGVMTLSATNGDRVQGARLRPMPLASLAAQSQPPFAWQAQQMRRS